LACAAIAREQNLLGQADIEDLVHVFLVDLRCRDPNGELYGGKGTADLFLHITSNYKFMGFDILPDYGVFDTSRTPTSRALEDYKRHLEKHRLAACTIANIC
jgi:hypothetical protein